MGPNGPGDLNVQGDWEGLIELLEFGKSDDGWVNCTTGYYWHPALGGGICLCDDEWYRNWEFDYEPPHGEIVPDDYEPAQGEIVPEEPENVGDKEQDLPPQPPSHLQPQPQQQKSQSQLKSDPNQETSVARRTRSSQKTGDPPRTDDFTKVLV